jgi:hypothetical protein
LKNAQLKYTTTGHGGWENGDEFVPKANSIFLDGKMTYSFIPWRTDCGSYDFIIRLQEIFRTGFLHQISADQTGAREPLPIPTFIQLGDLKAGKHTIQVKIPQGLQKEQVSVHGMFREFC